MARNIDIKARIESVEVIAAKVAELADQGPIDIVQDDTFFVCERGRTKLRITTPCVKPCPEGMGEQAASAHIGHQLSEGEPSARGVEETRILMASLGISPEQLVEGAYVDLLDRLGKREDR
jgi:adenylate cyclase class IV